MTPRSRANARERLPSRNGLAERVAKAPQRVTARAGTSTATVKLVVSNKKSGAYGADASGVIRHPVFGRVNASGKRVFVAQRVQRGWFEDATIDSRPGMRAEVVAVLDDFADRITRGL